MKNLKSIVFALFIICDISCSKKEEVNVPPVLNDVFIDVRGLGAKKADVVTTLVATDANEDQLEYSIISQTRVGRASISISINSSTGQVLVEEPTSFVYDKSPTNIFEAVIGVTDGQLSTTGKLTIRITDPS